MEKPNKRIKMPYEALPFVWLCALVLYIKDIVKAARYFGRIAAGVMVLEAQSLITGILEL